MFHGHKVIIESCLSQGQGTSNNINKILFFLSLYYLARTRASNSKIYWEGSAEREEWCWVIGSRYRLPRARVLGWCVQPRLFLWFICTGNGPTDRKLGNGLLQDSHFGIPWRPHFLADLIEGKSPGNDFKIRLYRN